MKKIIALLMVVAMLFCFAGCGVEKKNEEEKEAAKDTIIVGYTIYEPMNYVDADGTLVGFDTELAKAVFEDIGYNVEFKKIEWGNKYTDLSAGTINCIWNGFTCNTADDDGVMRSDKVDFSYNYMENRQVIVVKEGTDITKAADLNKKIGYAEGGSAGEEYGKSFDGAVIKTVTAQTDALFQVNAGNGAFAVLDAQLAKSYCGKGDYASLKIVDDLSSDVEYYAVGFEKGSELTAKVNAAFEKLAEDGTIKDLAEKYGVANTAITDFSDQK